MAPHSNKFTLIHSHQILIWIVYRSAQCLAGPCEIYLLNTLFLSPKCQLLSQKIFFFHVKTLLTFRKSLFFGHKYKSVKMFSVQNLQQKKSGSKIISDDRFSFLLGWKKTFFSHNQIYMSDWQSITPSPPQSDLPKCDLMAWSYTEILLKRSPFVIFCKLFNRETDFRCLKRHWFRKEWLFLFEI